MEFLSLFDHNRGVVETAIILNFEFWILYLFYESPIPTSDIENTLDSTFLHNTDEIIEFWPGVIDPTFRKCLGKVIIIHIRIIGNSDSLPNKKNNLKIEKFAFSQEKNMIFL